MRDKPFTFFVVCSYIGTTLSLIYVICISVVSTNLHYGINVIDETVYSAMDDVTTYFNTTKSQYDFVTSKSNRWFNEEVIQSDIKNAGDLIWQPGRDRFHPNVKSIFKSLSDLDERSKNAAKRLEAVHSKLSSITTGVGARASSNLSQLHYDLTFIRSDWSCSGCDGSCPGCSDIIVDDIFYQTDFTKLPNITSNVEQLSELTQKPFRQTMQNPEYYYDRGMSEILTDKITVPITELNQTITKYSDSIETSTSDLIFPTEEDFHFPEFRKSFPSFDRRLVISDTVRYGFTWVVCFANLVGCLLVYFALTWTVKGKREARRGGQPNYYPAYLIYMGTIGGCIVLPVIFMALAMMTFYGGTNLEKLACQPGKNLQYMTEILDKPDMVADHPGYFMASVILRRPNVTLRSEDIYRSCQQNKGAFSVFNHHVLLPSIFSHLDHVQAFKSANLSFEKMYVDFTDTPLLSADFETWISSFNTGAFFNLTAYENMLRSRVMKADVQAYIDNLMTVYNTSRTNGGPGDPSKAGLLRVAETLNAYKNDIATITRLKDEALANFEVYKAEIEHIKAVTTDAVTNLRGLDGQFRAESADNVKMGVDKYREEFLATYAHFVNKTHHWIQGLGGCQPLSDAYDAVLYGFCDRLTDFENAQWMLLGNNCVTLLCLLFLLSVVMYFLPDDDGDDTTDEFESVFGNGPPKGLINKAIYKVKRVFIQRRPSQKRPKTPGSGTDSNGSNVDPLLNKNSMEMKNLPNGNVMQAKNGKSQSPTDGIASPRTQPTNSTASLPESVSTPSLDADTKSGTSKGSAGTNRSKGVISHGSEAPSGRSSRPGSVVISEVHPRPKGMDLSPNIAPGTLVNNTGRRPSNPNASVLVTDLET